MGDTLDDRPKIPAPRVEYDQEVQDFARRMGARLIMPGIEFGPVYPLEENVAQTRADASRDRLLGKTEKAE